MIILRRTLLTVVLSMLVIPVAPAHAGTFSMEGDDLVYTADTGEVNAVVMTDVGPNTDVVLTDNGASAVSDPTGRCDVVGLQATCHLIGVHDVGILLGDGNDTFDASSCTHCYYYSDAFYMIVDGGADQDTLIGSSLGDVFSGGLGNDIVRGNDGDDVFIAQSVADGSDTLVGGAGTDKADYSLRTRRVVVSLDGRRNDGFPGELDQVGTDIEDILGGSGPDMLTGSRLANELRGEGGADTIVGGLGRDTLLGGAGNDTIRSADAFRDVVDGGAGRDTAVRDRRDRLIRIEVAR